MITKLNKKFSKQSFEYIKRFWPLGLGQIIGVSLGVQVLVSADSNVLKICLGLIVLLNIALRATQWRLKIPRNREAISGPVGGLAAGMVGGTTSFVGPLLVLYLSSLENLKKDILEYHNDPLSNMIAIHVTGTENQADGEFYVGGFHKTLWFKKRVPVWTASNFLVCHILLLFQVDNLSEAHLLPKLRLKAVNK